jgi:hypothetical protein
MNQIETQMNKLRLLGMVKSWTALQETRTPVEGQHGFRLQ